MKYISLLFLITSLSSFAQIQKVWDKSLSAGLTEDPVLVNKNSDNTIDVISSISKAGGDVIKEYGSQDFWFCKMNASGQVISNNTYGGTQTDICTDAVKTNDGGYLIVGISSSGQDGIKNLPLPANNSNVLWILKTDKDGQLQWQRQVAACATGCTNGYISSSATPFIVSTSSGYCIIYNTFKAVNSQNVYSTDFASIDFSGNPIAAYPTVFAVPDYPNNTSSQNNLLLRNAIQLASGNILAMGYGFKNGNTSKKIALAVEILPNGKYVSHNEYESSGDCQIIGCKELADNGDKMFFAHSMHNNSTGFKRTVSSKASSGNYDIWAFKTNNVGTSIITQSAIGCSGNLFWYNSNPIVFTNTSAHLLLSADGVGADKTENPRGKTDFWYVNFDLQNSSVAAQKTWGGTEREIPASIYVDENNAYMLGVSESGTTGDKTDPLKSFTSDIWLVKSCLPPPAPQIANSVPIFGSNAVLGCEGSQTVISLSNPNPLYTYTWYSAPTGGNILGSGTSITTPFLAQLNNFQTVYVETNYQGCNNTRTPGSVVAIPTPKAPSAAGNKLLCKGSQLFLSAQRDTSPNSSAYYYKSRWYDSTGTNIIHYGDTLIINNVQKSIKLYLSTVDSFPTANSPIPTKICESSRTPVTIQIDFAPTPLIAHVNPNCLYNSTTLTCNNSVSNTVNWYDSKNNLIHTGISFVYTNNTLSDTLYTQIITANNCFSDITKTIVKVQHPTPAEPLVTNAYNNGTTQNIPTCTGSSLLISLANPNTAHTYTWYSVPTGGNILGSGTTLSIPAISPLSHYEYWIEASNGYCLSNKKQVVVEKLKTPKAPYLTAPSKICKGDTLILIAEKDTGFQNGAFFISHWKDATGQIVHYGDTLIIPNVTKADKYYCTTIDSIPFGFFPGLGAFICESSVASKQVNVDSIPTPAVQVSSPSCVGSNVAITITNLQNAFANWYNNKGTWLGSGINYYIYNIQKNDTVICETVGINGCKNSRKVFINAEKPIALFTTPKTILKEGDMIQFNNQSIAGSTASWDFGDGSISYQKNPWHYFYEAGKYTIQLVSISSNGCVDTLIKKDYIIVNPAVGVANIELPEGIKVFPNPFMDKINIGIPSNAHEINIVLMSSLGQEILSKTIHETSIITTEQLPAGIYFLTIKTKSQQKTIKLVRP